MKSLKVSEETHHTVKVNAATAGKTIDTYLKDLIND